MKAGKLISLLTGPLKQLEEGGAAPLLGKTVELALVVSVSRIDLGT